MVEKIEKSVIPIYSVGIMWLLWALFLPMYNVFLVLLATGISICVYFLMSRVFPGKRVLVPAEININKTGDTFADSILEKGKEFIKELNELNMKIDNPDMTRNISEITDTSEKIFEFISNNPENARQINTFIDYYYPTTIKLLNSYVELSAQPSMGNNVKSTISKIEHGIKEIIPVFKKQLDNLFADKALDISTDIDVMKTILKSEGLGGVE